ncbi:MAG: two-component regulator propeller domain-containing protein [Bacteroidota bacterium]
MITLRNIRSVVLFCLLMILTVSLSARQHRSVFVQYTTRNGLSSNLITGAARDSNGFIWISTPNGIHRFNGSVFQRFPYDTASFRTLSTDYSSCFSLDANRILFFETSGRIDSYDYRTGRIENFSASHGFDSIGCISAYRDSRGRVWFATYNGIVLLNSDGHGGKEYRISAGLKDEPNDNRVNKIREDANGRLWLAMFSKGIFLFDPAAGTFLAPMKRSLYHLQVHGLAVADNGRSIWAATGGEGVLKIDAATFSIERITRRFPRPLSTMMAVPSIHIYKDSIVWIGTLNGLIEYEPSSARTVLHANDPNSSSSISNNTILFIDDFDDDLCWFGTQKGLNSYSVAPPRFRKIARDPAEKNTLPTNSVNNVWEDSHGNEWYSTSVGLSVRDKRGRMYHYALAPRRDVNVIHCTPDRDNNLWIATWGDGLIRTRIPEKFTPGDALRFESFTASGGDNAVTSNYFKKIIVDPSGDIIAISWGGGINIISNEARNARTLIVQSIRRGAGSGPMSDYIGDICPGAEGTYWLTFGNGLQRWDRRRNSFSTFLANPSHPDDPMNASTYLVKDSNGTLWVGTTSGLLSITVGADGSPRLLPRINRKDLFCFQPVIDLDGSVWFGAPHSLLMQFIPVSNEVRRYDLTYELNGYEFNFGYSALMKNGDLLFSSSDGFLRFSPKSFTQQQPVPRLTVTDISIPGADDRLIGDASGVRAVTLPYNRNSITVTFAALIFDHPERVHYQYLLEGTSSGWIATENRTTVSFANLSPGEYSFRVRASGDDGSWQTESMPLTFTILPPFWATFMFRISVGASIVLMVAWYVRRTVNGLRKEQERQRNVAKQLIDSQETERKRIAGELHDGIGQNLLIISNTLQLFLAAKRRKTEDIVTAVEMTKEAVREIRSISSNLHPHQLERLGLKRALLSMADTAGKTTGTRLTVTIQDGLELQDPEQEIHLFRIVQEIVNNIIKHAHASEAVIALTRTNSDILLTARDNGRGFDINANASEGLGMTSLKERTRLLNGSITLRSAADQGTEITITIPLHG